MLFKYIIIPSKNQIFLSFCRWRHRHGKPPGIALSLQSRLELTKPKAVHKVDIGFPGVFQHSSRQKSNEKPSINDQKELIDLEKVKLGSQYTSEPYRIKKIAEHYGIYNDLFNNAYFVPRMPLKIKYKSASSYSNVFNGNVIKPLTAIESPDVEFDGNLDLLTGKISKSTNYWSIILLNPDAKTLQSNDEYVHWFLANIPANDIKNGEDIVPYLQPLPYKGIGYQRYIFILFKQEDKLDFNSFRIQNEKSLDQRLFNMDKFYRKYQENLTPAGLSFFQSNWDESVNEVFHKKFNGTAKEVQYDFPRPYITDPKWFPLRAPFNSYMDKHRDPKEVNMPILKRWLKERHPFKEHVSLVRFPHAQPIKNVPSWLAAGIRKQRLFEGDKNSIKRNAFYSSGP